MKGRKYTALIGKSAFYWEQHKKKNALLKEMEKYGLKFFDGIVTGNLHSFPLLL